MSVLCVCAGAHFWFHGNLAIILKMIEIESRILEPCLSFQTGSNRKLAQTSTVTSDMTNLKCLRFCSFILHLMWKQFGPMRNVPSEWGNTNKKIRTTKKIRRKLKTIETRIGQSIEKLVAERAFIAWLLCVSLWCRIAITSYWHVETQKCENSLGKNKMGKQRKC